MSEVHEKSRDEEIRGNQETEELWDNTNSRKNVGGISRGDGTECFSPHRKDRSPRNPAKNIAGGILDQLIEDARKQLVKTRECIVWYQNELDEYKAKIQHLEELKALEETEEDDEQDIEEDLHA
jgi:hypothetical protein